MPQKSHASFLTAQERASLPARQQLRRAQVLKPMQTGPRGPTGAAPRSSADTAMPAVTSSPAPAPIAWRPSRRPSQLKKTGCPAENPDWVIPPQADAEFVAHMVGSEDEQRRIVPSCACRRAAGAVVRKPARRRTAGVDEYDGPASAVFLFSEPLAGWRQATGRTKVDWALEVAGLLEETSVCDHLRQPREQSRPLGGSSHEFPHAETLGEHPENELSSMTGMRAGRRIGDLGTLHDEVSASTDVNGTQRGVRLADEGRRCRCPVPRRTTSSLRRPVPPRGHRDAAVPARHRIALAVPQALDLVEDEQRRTSMPMSCSTRRTASMHRSQSGVAASTTWRKRRDRQPAEPPDTSLAPRDPSVCPLDWPPPAATVPRAGNANDGRSACRCALDDAD